MRIDNLAILRGSDVYWKGHGLKLSTAQTLLLCAVARANGVWVSHSALGEAIGYEGDLLTTNLSSHFYEIRRAFKAVDPTFDGIERFMGRPLDGPMSRGARWRPERVKLAV